jgi:hypothetical protein
MRMDLSNDGRYLLTATTKSSPQQAVLGMVSYHDLTASTAHTLAHDKLLAKLKSVTNLRVIKDANSPNGYKLDVGPFPGWEQVPTW